MEICALAESTQELREKYNHPMIGRAIPLSCLVTTILIAVPAVAAEHRVIGLSASGKPIEALVVSAAPPTAPTVVLVGGLTGDSDSGRRIAAEVADLESTPIGRRRFHLFAIPLANPDKS